MRAVGAYIFAGGFTIGVKEHFDVLAHLEGDKPYGADSAKLNWPDLPVYFGPSRWPVDRWCDPPLDFFYTNPPCAVFSPMGIVTTRGKEAWRADPRLSCWYHSFSVLERIKPRAWVLESVPQAYTVGRPVIDELTKRALLLGYSVTHLFIDAAWYGIAQQRKRFFLVCHRPPELVGWRLNWQPPPTVAETLVTVPAPGNVQPITRADLVEALTVTPPGGRLSTSWMDQHPGYAERLNAQGKVAGRPSFQDVRLPLSAPMKVFPGGEKIYHPTEHRRIGIDEAKALCGFPLDFKLAGNPSGWSSLLARGVMPPVAEWLARVIRTTLEAYDDPGPEAAWLDRRVTLLDLRTPETAMPVDLTRTYLDERGRVKLTVRVGETTILDSARAEIASALGVDVADVKEVGSSRVGRAADAAATLNAETSDGCVNHDHDVPAVRDRGDFEGLNRNPSPTPPGPRVAAPARGSLPDVTVPPERGEDGLPVPAAGEGSGRFMQRCWLLGELTPEALVDLVHARYAGRTTRTSDVYYNYRKLLDAGLPNVPPWRSSSAARSSRVRSASTIPATAVAPPQAASSDGRPRFLVTGSTPVQCGSEKTKLKIVTAIQGYVEALRELGYNVDWRAVRPGEDLRNYVGVMTALNKVNAIASGNVYGALWALSSRQDAIVVIDDWQTEEIRSGFKTYARSRERAFRLRSGGDVEDQLFALIQTLAVDPWPQPTLVPLFDGGRAELLKLPATAIVPVDPTTFVKRYAPQPSHERRHLWVQASLAAKRVPTAAWLVYHLGALDRGKGGVGRSGDDAQERVPEEDLMGIYGRAWGVLSPPHPHAGSGWWRVRYLMSADAGCVLSADPREAAVLGEAYEIASDRAEVERLSDSELGELAAAQADRLREIAWPRERVLQTLDDLIRSRGGASAGRRVDAAAAA